MSNFVVNIIHRPELSPEYAEKAMGGKSETGNESLDIFLFQQKAAHDNGLKTTIQITYASLFSDQIIEIAKEQPEKHGDELALSPLGLPCQENKEKSKTDHFCNWMFDEATNRVLYLDV